MVKEDTVGGLFILPGQEKLTRTLHPLTLRMRRTDTNNDDPLLDTGLTDVTGDAVNPDKMTKRRTRNLLVANLIILFLAVGGELYALCLSQFVYAKIAAYVTGGNVTVIASRPCFENESSPGFQIAQHVQELAAQKNQQFSLAMAIPAMVTNIFTGAYSDYLGRKFLFFLAIFGYLARVACTTIVAFYNFDLNYLFIGILFDALCGGTYTMILAVNVYTADNTPPSGTRTLGMALVGVGASLSMTLGQFAGGYFIQAAGFFYPFLVSALLAALALVTMMLVLEETKPRSSSDFRKCPSPWQGIKNVFGFYFSRSLSDDDRDKFFQTSASNDSGVQTGSDDTSSSNQFFNQRMPLPIPSSNSNSQPDLVSAGSDRNRGPTNLAAGVSSTSNQHRSLLQQIDVTDQNLSSVRTNPEHYSVESSVPLDSPRPQAILSDSQSSNLNFRTRRYPTEEIIQNSRLENCLGILVFFVASLPTVGSVSIDSLYIMNMPFCWDSQTMGTFGTIQSIVTIMLCIVALKILPRFVRDELLGIVGMLSMAGSFALKAFANQTWMIYVAAAIGVLGPLSPLEIRSLMSQRAPSGKQGSLFASQAVVETLCSAVGGLMFNSLYSQTVRYFRGTTYLLMAAICLLAILLMGMYIVVLRKNKKDISMVFEEPTHHDDNDDDERLISAR